MNKKVIMSIVMVGLLLVQGVGEAKKKKACVRHKKTHRVARVVSNQAVPLLAGSIGLQRIVDEMNRHASAGVAIQSLRTGDIIYQQHANQFFSPASNMKVITAFAALKFLGPNFVYHTRLMTEQQARINQGVLEGNLYLQYSGDPTLQLSDINALFSQLTARGIYAIRGQLMVDASRYADEGIPPGTEQHDQAYCYGAPVSTAIINQNCLSFKMYPGKTGEKARLEFPYGVPLTVSNQVVTRATHYCHYSFKPQPGGTYALSGSIRAHASPVAFTVTISPGSHYGESAAATLLARNGIRVMGESLPAVTESNMQLIADAHSAPLSVLVVDMMKHSNNMIANALFKTIGALYHQTSANWENSSTAVVAILKSSGVDVAGMHILDGAGLSRDNRVTPMQLLQVLAAAYHDPNVSPSYLQALPIGGLDGTLRHRLGTRDVIGKVQAKTGTMHDVSSLSGYVEGNSGEILTFSIIVNDFNGGIYFYHALQDKLCRVMRVSY
ncbi:MAG: D-alanyl-D-alanine carboxypeptidase/D-alanyl-D-alanine-endopeptidase [Gammaproteobacteria bacterium]|nr:D-alanyl-D-alanine carboxypeptidase/D-alanyl-D-alanine-endopeptidase [Gammaproteobacteria bacterium]